MVDTQASIADKRRTFQRLHDSGCFVLPNPWDIGSARYLESLGFKALATTSSGFAWSNGLADGAVPKDLVLAHLHDVVEATHLPINADFESGYAADAGGVADNVRLAVEAGVAGISIEDSTGRPTFPLYDIDTAVTRIAAARTAIDRTGGDVMLVGRCECFLWGRPDLEETIARLKRYANAGADCLFAPGIRTPEQISAVVASVAPKPVNLLIGWATDLTVQDVAELGVRRISVGGALARSAWAGLMSAARQIAEEGRFNAFANSASGQQIDRLFST